MVTEDFDFKNALSLQFFDSDRTITSEWFTSISIVDGYENPCRIANITFNHPDIINEYKNIALATKCKIVFDDITLFIGYVTDCSESLSSNGSQLNLTLKDFVYLLEDSTIMSPIMLSGGESIQRLIELFAGDILSANGIKLEIDEKTAQSTWNKASASGSGNKIEFIDPVTKQNVKFDSSSASGASLKEFQPKVGDGIYEILIKLLHNRGLHLRAGFDGDREILIIDSPSNYIEPDYQIDEYFSSRNIDRNLQQQIPIMLLTGHGSHGLSYANSPLRSVALNEFTAFDSKGNVKPEIQSLLDKLKIKKVLPINKNLLKYGEEFNSKHARLSHFDHGQSQTQSALDSFCFRKMKNRQRDAIQLTLEVPSWIDVYRNKIWVSDTVLKHMDKLWYISEVTLKYSASGSTTSLKCCVHQTMQFGEQ